MTRKWSMRRFRTAVLGVVLAAAALVLPSSSVAAVTDPVPVLAGPPVQVATELGYVAFPNTVKAVNGKYYTFYAANSKHNDPNGRLSIRSSTDGVVWDIEPTMPGQTNGYSWGAGAVAAQTAEQGGKILVAVLRLHWIPGSETIDEVRAFLTTLDLATGAWTPMVALPVVTGIGLYPSDLLILPDGKLLLSGYITDTAYYLWSGNGGSSWSTATAVTIPGRIAVEPTLARLSDGKIVSFLRSDAPAPYSDRLYLTAHDADITTGSWAAPTVVTYDGGGRPGATVLPSGHVAVLYRGYSDKARPTYRPMRILMFKPAEGTYGLTGYRGNIDVLAGETGRYLYGGILPVGTGYRVVYGLEGPDGQAGGAAWIYSAPLTFQST